MVLTEGIDATEKVLTEPHGIKCGIDLNILTALKLHFIVVNISCQYINIKPKKKFPLLKTINNKHIND